MAIEAAGDREGIGQSVKRMLLGLALTSFALLFAALSYGQFKARPSGRANAFADKVGNRRNGAFSGGVVFAWLAILFAGGATSSVMGW